MKNLKSIHLSATIAIALAAGSVSSQAIVFDPSNGHYYDVIFAPNISWMSAEQQALTYTYNGLEGHLATITSAAEDTYVGNAVSAAGSGEFWLGGYQNPITETIPTAGWTWVNGEGTFPGVNGATGFDNNYSNWNPGEPNDAYGPASEQYLGINLGTLGGFNDEGNLGLINGYVIEYDPNTIPTGGLVGSSAPDSACTAALMTGALGFLGLFSRRLKN